MALNPLVSLIGRLVARSGRKRGNRQTDRQTDRQNDKTTTVILAAHARRGLIRTDSIPAVATDQGISSPTTHTSTCIYTQHSNAMVVIQPISFTMYCDVPGKGRSNESLLCMETL